MLDSEVKNAVLSKLSDVRLQIAEIDAAFIEQRITEAEYQKLLQAANKELDAIEELLKGDNANE